MPAAAGDIFHLSKTNHLLLHKKHILVEVNVLKRAVIFGGLLVFVLCFYFNLLTGILLCELRMLVIKMKNNTKVTLLQQGAI